MTADLSPILDSSVRPQDDFFKHVNGIWLNKNPIPANESRWGTFNILREKSWTQMRNIYQDLQSSQEGTGTEQQARDFFYSGINFDTCATEHWQTIKQYSDKINQATDKASLSRVIGELHRIGVNAPWSMIIDTDDKNSSQYLVRLYQSGLSLPDRDYYLSDETDMAAVREKYQHLLSQVHEVWKDLRTEKDEFIKTVFEIEKNIAKAQRTRSELRDVEGNYNSVSFEELQKIYSHIDWAEYAKGTHWTYTKNISHDQPGFMVFINQQFHETDVARWRIYLKWQLLRKFLPCISEETAKLHFEFYGKVIAGTKEMSPLWRRVVMNIDHLIGENVGRLYAEKHFPEKSKQKVLSMVDKVTEAFAERIKTLDWMSEKTKDYAIKKLRNMKVLIGYPDEWRDFSGLKIVRNSYVGNIIQAETFNHDYLLSQLDKPNRRDQWHYMSPQTVNAYHDPNRLVICFPAGILQAPFFDIEASDAKNFGGIGTVIAHELTHAFDDQGCQFDAEGNVRQWQTAAERKRFTKKAEIIKKQADVFEVLPNVKLKGDLVIGESIADLGGLEISLHALCSRDQQDTNIEQIREFFINYACTESSTTREQLAREYALVDPHPPSEFRVNAILQHVDSFYEVFSLAPEDKLFRPESERAKIW